MKSTLALILVTLVLVGCGKAKEDSAALTSQSCEQTSYRCTLESSPQTCSSNGLKADGENRCMATINLVVEGCKQGISADQIKSSMSCVASF